MFLFIFERERSHEWWRGRERGGHGFWSGLHADSREPDAGLELTNHEIMTWTEVGRLTDWTTQAPLLLGILIVLENRRLYIFGAISNENVQFAFAYLIYFYVFVVCFPNLFSPG